MILISGWRRLVEWAFALWCIHMGLSAQSPFAEPTNRERELFFPPVIAILHYRHLDPGGTVAPGSNQEAERVSKLMCLSERDRERWKKKRECPEKKKKKNE